MINLDDRVKGHKILKGMYKIQNSKKIFFMRIRITSFVLILVFHYLFLYPGLCGHHNVTKSVIGRPHVPGKGGKGKLIES